MEKVEAATFSVEEERVAWEGLAQACSPPLRRLGAFMLVGFTAFITMMTLVVLLYNVFGERAIEGAGVAVPHVAFYATLASSFALALGGYLVWLVRSLRTYRSFSEMLRRGGLDPKRPTVGGLRAYSDEQLLALRSRYERLGDTKLRERFGRTFGFSREDSFATGPLWALPRTFEMNTLRVEWETNLILKSGEPMSEISWWTESQTGLLPRRADETRRLTYALRYTSDSVRELKVRYGYRADRWHKTVPEGKLWDAVRDYEEARRIRSALQRRPRS